MTAVLCDITGHVARLTINRPEALNAMDSHAHLALSEALDAIEANDAVRVVVLTGAGPKAFSAGRDLKEVAAEREMDDADRAALARRWAATRRLTDRHDFHKPVIAAVNGIAYGGGFELALACDIRIAADDATFGVFEIRRGLHPGDGGLVRLVAIAGAGVAMELALTGRPVSADEALQLRLVSRVVARDELLAEAARTAATIAGHGPHAVRSAKETILDLIGRPLDDALRLEALNGYTSFGSADELRHSLERGAAAQRRP